MRAALFLVLLGGFQILSAQEEISYFRKIRIDQEERIRGEYPLAEEDAGKVNSYKFFIMSDGRISRIEYHRSGTSLADPLLGVPVIQFGYNGSFIRRTYLDSRAFRFLTNRGFILSG